MIYLENESWVGHGTKWISLSGNYTDLIFSELNKSGKIYYKEVGLYH